MTGKRRLGRDPVPPGDSGQPTPPASPASQPAPSQPAAYQPAPPQPASPAPPTTTIAPPKSRRQLRAERRRQARRRFGAAGIAAIVVVALVVAAAITFGVKKATSGGGHELRGQQTLLFSVVDPEGSATQTVLLAHDDRKRTGLELLVPSRVLTDVCGFGNQALGDIIGLPDGVKLSRTAMSDLLGGVTVGGSWVLTQAQFGTLLQKVGGITADVDVDVVERRNDGGRVLLVPHGDGQHLTGVQAATYAAYTSPGEEAAANLVRVQAVLEGFLAALPMDEGTVRSLITSLGKGAGSTQGPDRLAETLVGLARDDVLPVDLPVVKIDAGDSEPSYRVDDSATRTLVDANLAASLPASARVARKRVFVQNGVGTSGLAPDACGKLVAAGYAFAGSGNAAHFGYPRSEVIVFDATAQAATLGRAVARTLGLPASDVSASDSGQNIADVLVILGKDYKP